jgi:hypothetical protein
VDEAICTGFSAVYFLRFLRFFAAISTFHLEIDAYINFCKKYSNCELSAGGNYVGLYG